MSELTNKGRGDTQPRTSEEFDNTQHDTEQLDQDNASASV